MINIYHVKLKDIKYNSNLLKHGEQKGKIQILLQETWWKRG